jgi:hypothetical protein
VTHLNSRLRKHLHYYIIICSGMSQANGILWYNKTLEKQIQTQRRGKQKRTEEVSFQNAVLAVLPFQEKTLTLMTATLHRHIAF